MNIFQKSQKIVLILGLFLGLMSCTNRDEAAVPVPSAKASGLSQGPVQTFNNLDANRSFVKFNFSKNAVVTDDNWDVAFFSTNIIVNAGVAKSTAEPARTGQGGLYLVNSLFDELNNFDEKLLKKDHTDGYALPTGSGNGWYTYNSSSHIVSPIPGKILAIKTHNGHWVKMQILSYYKDMPEKPTYDSAVERTYSFKFAISR